MGCQVTFLYLKPFLSLFSLKVDRVIFFFVFCPKISAYNSAPLNMASEMIPVDEVRRQDNPDEVYWSFKPVLDI